MNLTEPSADAPTVPVQFFDCSRAPVAFTLVERGVELEAGVRVVSGLRRMGGLHGRVPFWPAVRSVQLRPMNLLFEKNF